MRLKLDENLPASVAPRLRELEHDVETVPGEGLAGADDERIWTMAQTERRFLITQDLDFSDMRRFAPGSHHGVLVVRVPEADQWRVRELVSSWLTLPEARTWERCLVVATPRKVRVRRPGRG